MAQLRSSKFMTNILQESKHRTRYVKMLKDISPDAQVSYQRIIVGIGLFTFVVATSIWILTHAGPKIGLIAPPVITVTVGLLVILVVYIISSRGKSMLSSVSDYVLFQVTERARRKTARNARVSTIGVRSIEDGGPDWNHAAKLTFDNGDVGLIYSAEGQLSLSVLPSVVNATMTARHRHLVSRMATTTEYLLTSVQRADVRSKLDYLRATYERAKADGDPFTAHMADMLWGYVNSEMGEKDVQIFQSLILREVDDASLRKAQKLLADSTYSGMYAVIDTLNKEDAVSRLRALTLISDDAAEQLSSADTNHGKAK